MTQTDIDLWSESQVASAPAGTAFVEGRARSLLQPILLLVPVILSGVSYYSGGAPLLTDFAFVVLSVLCVTFVVAEIYSFDQRLGIGGLVVYGGVLVWFCYDYFNHWFLRSIPTWQMPFSQETVAKSAFAHTLLVLAMSVGLRLRIGRWLPRWVARMPEPTDQIIFVYIIVLTQIIGFLPYLLFTVEPFYLAIWHQIVAGRGGGGTEWTVGRTGNLNYNWGGYLAQIIQVGSGGGVFAAYYAIFLARSWRGAVACMAVWAVWLLMGFGTGTRGEVGFMLLPLAGFLMIKFHSRGAEFLHRFRFRAYVIGAMVIFVGLVLVQVQGRFRNAGFLDADLSSVELTNLQGNAMFSEGLTGFSLIPEHRNYFYDQFPMATTILPIPNFIYWMAIHPIPRVLWNDKPVDPAGPWYNDVALGGSGEFGGRVEGTTISEGMAGYWFFRYGFIGIVEGGLLVGWILFSCEKMLLNCNGRTLPVFFSLGVATWLFRCYRDISFPEFYEMCMALFCISALILTLSPFGQRPAIEA